MSDDPVKALPPGAVVGIMGGGQLGRMLAMAAAQLGYQVHIYSPEADCPATDTARYLTCAGWDDEAALSRFADQCDVISFEFENVPAKSLHLLEQKHLLRPGARALEIAQSRLDEKNFVAELGGRTADYAMVETRDALEKALEKTGRPAILKSNRMGYDGKGQARIFAEDDRQSLDHKWQDAGARPAIVESLVSFDAEFSILMVRCANGGVYFWDVPENEHRGGILARTMVPAGESVATHLPAARALSRRIAEKLDYVGVMALEFFACEDGPVFNEMAPRVHNSGHWTIEGAFTSQFENHIRAICGLPIGDTRLACNSVEMTNLIGEDVLRRDELLSDPACHVHIYGKAEARAGRKMGHVTRISL